MYISLYSSVPLFDFYVQIANFKLFERYYIPIYCEKDKTIIYYETFFVQTFKTIFITQILPA
jgi:hypothetical protein